MESSRTKQHKNELKYSQFGAENAWLTDMASFHSIKPSDFRNPNSGTPSKLFIEAIEPSVIIQIALIDLVFLFENYPKFNRIFRIIVENNFIELQNRVLQNISNTAEECYISFLNQYPNLSNRLPNTQIASFLGITPKFLSTIRKTMTKLIEQLHWRYATKRMARVRRTTASC